LGRVFGLTGIVFAMAIALYIYSKQVQSLSGPAGTPVGRSVIDITGVKGDLIGIANAERVFFAEQSRYASFDELVSGKYISIRSERPPYSYSVQTTSQGFRVTATSSTPGTPSTLSIDETMEVRTSD
jgi:hypothetical protein